MEKAILEPVIVYSPIEDKDIRNTLGDSSIWKQSYTIDELAKAKRRYAILFEYSFKFEGTKIRQFTGVKKIVK